MTQHTILNARMGQHSSEFNRPWSEHNQEQKAKLCTQEQKYHYAGNCIKSQDIQEEFKKTYTH